MQCFFVPLLTVSCYRCDLNAMNTQIPIEWPQGMLTMLRVGAAFFATQTPKNVNASVL